MSRNIDAFGLLNASVSYQYNQWSVALFGSNLTDEDAFSHTFAVVPPVDGAFLAA